MEISFNLATYLKPILNISSEEDPNLTAEVVVEENGFDPVSSATLTVTPAKRVPFACHLLFPEIRVDRLPASIQLNCTPLTGNVHMVIDGADRTGPCVALPFYRDGAWCQGSNAIRMDRDYMVWKEGAKRVLVPPVRLKYLLVISTDGNPVSVTVEDLVLIYDES